MVKVMTIPKKDLATLGNEELLTELVFAAGRSVAARVASQFSQFVEEDLAAAEEWSVYAEEIKQTIFKKMSK